jgi:ubiquinone/menaquinone biosynthesis C-methylase UbiE
LAKPRYGRVNPLDDITRLREEYEDRKRRFANSDVYSWFNAANLFNIHQRQRWLLATLKSHNFTNISKFQILEMGCGSGGVLTEFLSFGASPQNLFGIDLLADRLSHAKKWLSTSHFSNADGQDLPFPSQSFDLIMQFTALSSILDSSVRQKICSDMLRVLKPSGLILWYDFWLNPTNSQTHGIRPAEIRRLFSGCRFDFQRITLAPPIARRLVPVSWLFCAFLEKLKIFNTHYLVAISEIP